MLDDDLIDLIIFSMEDQTQELYIDTKEKILTQSYNENCINIPSWNSSDGFLVMKSFVNELEESKDKKQLKSILSFTGKGVFKTFKSYLSENEELLNKFRKYKNKAMKKVVIEELKQISIEKTSYGFDEFSFEINLENFTFIDKDSPLIENSYIYNIRGENKANRSLQILLDDNLIGYINYSLDNNDLYIGSYEIKEQYQKLGLFKLAINRLIELKNPKSLSIFDYNDMKLDKMFKLLGAKTISQEYKLIF